MIFPGVGKYLLWLPFMEGRSVILREKNNKAEREIHQPQQHLTNKARTLPNAAAAAVKCFCVLSHLLASHSNAPSLSALPHLPPPFISPSPSKSPFPFESNSTSGGGRSPQKCFCPLRQNRFRKGLRHDLGQLHWFVPDRRRFSSSDQLRRTVLLLPLLTELGFVCIP